MGEECCLRGESQVSTEVSLHPALTVWIWETQPSAPGRHQTALAHGTASLVHPNALTTAHKIASFSTRLNITFCCSLQKKKKKKILLNTETSEQLVLCAYWLPFGARERSGP